MISVDDFYAAEASRVERFALFGISQGVAVCIAYAAKYPERVSHLVLYGGFARGSTDFTPGVSAAVASARVRW